MHTVHCCFIHQPFWMVGIGDSAISFMSHFYFIWSMHCWRTGRFWRWSFWVVRFLLNCRQYWFCLCWLSIVGKTGVFPCYIFWLFRWWWKFYAYRRSWEDALFLYRFLSIWDSWGGIHICMSSIQISGHFSEKLHTIFFPEWLSLVSLRYWAYLPWW